MFCQEAYSRKVDSVWIRLSWRYLEPRYIGLYRVRPEFWISFRNHFLASTGTAGLWKPSFTKNWVLCTDCSFFKSSLMWKVLQKSNSVMIRDFLRFPVSTRAATAAPAEASEKASLAQLQLAYPTANISLGRTKVVHFSGETPHPK